MTKESGPGRGGHPVCGLHHFQIRPVVDLEVKAQDIDVIAAEEAQEQAKGVACLPAADDGSELVTDVHDHDYSPS